MKKKNLMDLLRRLIMMQIIAISKLKLNYKKRILKDKVYKLLEMIVLLELIQYLMWKK